MGGDRITPSSSTLDDDSSVDKSFNLPRNFEDGMENGSHESGFGGAAEMGRRSPLAPLEVEANQRRRFRAYRYVMQSYDQLRLRSDSFEETKRKILSYTPGGWIENASGVKLDDYDVPKTTTLLLVGPRGSGKSSLVNKISNVFEDDEFPCERAQVSYNFRGDGTYFLQEYMIPRGSTSFCLYDTRSLSGSLPDDLDMLRDWITNGVRSGKLIVRPSDSLRSGTRMRHNFYQGNSRSNEARMVNFVIFVVNGLAVLKSMESDDDEGKQYMQKIASTFNSPCLSFRDDKPVVVVTHGDLLSLADRTRVRIHLGETLGIPPVKQIFDIPESYDPVTNLTIIDMLHHALEHADKNLPHKYWLADKVRKVFMSPVRGAYIIAAIAVLFVWILQILDVHAHKSKAPRAWHTMRHLWLE